MGKKDEDPLALALAAIEKQFGKGAVMRLGDDPLAPPDVFSTGCIALDTALGIGGLPYGRIVELYGPESGGKTTLALSAIAQVQKQGKVVAFVDAEHALDPEWARTNGVDTDALLLSQPDSGEQALEITDMLVRSGGIGAVVIDSVSALVPQAELDGDMGAHHVGLQARLMSQGLRKLTGGASNTKTTVLFINQLREKVGVIFGSPETTSGGKALKFYASIRLDVRRKETLKLGTDPIGNRVRVKVVKNKCSPPHKVAEFDLIFGAGISRLGELVDLGVETGALRKAGSHYTTAPGAVTLESLHLGNGRLAAREYLAEHTDVADTLEAAIRFSLKGLGGIHPRLEAVAEPEVLIPAGADPPWDGGAVWSDGAGKGV